MVSGEVIEECLLGFPNQLFLQFCFRTDLVESVYVVNVEAASQIIQRISFDSLCFRYRHTKNFGNAVRGIGFPVAKP